MITQEVLNQNLAKALINLYDFVLLEQNPLCNYLPEEQKQKNNHLGKALQQAIINQIESLKPLEQTPSLNKSWRIYNLLRLRYIEGFTIKETMNFLHLGDRQLRRENQKAINLLCKTIINEWNIKIFDPEERLTDEEFTLEFTIIPSFVDLREVLNSIISVFNKNIKTYTLNIDINLPENCPLVFTDRVLIRHLIITAIFPYITQENQDKYKILGEIKDNYLLLIIQGSWISIPWKEEEYKKLQKLFEKTQTILTFTNKCIVIKFPITNNKKILIIDDDEASIHLIRRYLTSLPYNLIINTDSKTAIQTAETIKPDLILLDVLLPNVDGWELLQQLKHNEKTEDIPIIICSAWNEPDIAYMLGANGFLNKNTLKDDFVQAIYHVMKSSKKSN